jgi:nicotinamide-nucleotide amidase
VTGGPATSVVAKLIRLGRTLAVAESCTGGMVCEAITSVPGSSEVLLGGVVAYSNAVKSSHLGVDARLIESYGAVSAEVAGAMAKGARLKLGADYGISTTGIAGPGGGSAEKPVGLVFVGLVDANGEDVYRLQLDGNRDEIRHAITNRLLVHLLERIDREQA